jgi:hypothetical protein
MVKQIANVTRWERPPQATRSFLGFLPGEGR